MSPPWIVAFVVLSSVVAALGIIMIGLLRRVIPLLEQEGVGGALDQSQFGVQPGTTIDKFGLFEEDGSRCEWTEFLDLPSILILISSGCQPCSELLPKLDDVGSSIGRIPILVIADSPEDELAEAFGRKWRVLYQRDASASTALRNRATPQAYFIEPSGEVIGRTIPNSAHDLRTLANLERRLTAIA